MTRPVLPGNPPLPEAIWQTLCSLGVPVELPADAILLTRGLEAEAIFLLEQGILQVDLTIGSRIALPAPSLVGEMSWLSGKPARAQVSAQQPCRLKRIPHQTLWDWAIANPGVGQELIQELSSLAMERLQGQFHQRPYLALIAHDGRKQDLLKVAATFATQLHDRPLLTTAHTGALLEQELGLRISRRVSSGPMGGDQEVGSLIVAGLVEAVLFFPDPLSSQPHSADVAALMRVCDVCGVPLATNPGTAHHLLKSLGQAARPH